MPDSSIEPAICRLPAGALPIELRRCQNRADRMKKSSMMLKRLIFQAVCGVHQSSGHERLPALFSGAEPIQRTQVPLCCITADHIVAAVV